MKDTQIHALIEAEKKRQKKVINLIASENYVSDDVLKALGSELTNKYAEGYPGKRYYGGNVIIDKIELLAQKRALKLFGLSSDSWHVNVQPLSGSPANLAVYTALVPKGETIMGMSLSHGGHLTHGHKVSATGKFWLQIPYGVDPITEIIDYKALRQQAIEEKPRIIVCGFTAYPRKVDFKKFREIADAVTLSDGTHPILMCDMSHFAGLIAGRAYPSPFDYADVVTTTVHKTLRGPRSAIIFVRKDLEIKMADNKIGKGARKKVSAAELVDKAVFPGLQGGPHINQIAAVAVALREADTPAFRAYAKQVMKNASVLAKELARLGWHVISGGTDSHLVLVDVWMGGIKKQTDRKNEKGAGGITGAEASDRLERAGIIVNKNTIPGEGRSAFDPSGIRLGTAAETTRGKKESDFVEIAQKIDQTLKK
ncbi:MAG: serine hydroxymethyltransferase [Candidatus Pacebacteria bacterium]|nr:serine hydroxymethyltransferase [Candidatus Paceibacterota bacterium]